MALRDQHAATRLNGLRPGLTGERAAGIIWTVSAQANYDSLVRARAWTHQEYRDWLADTLIAHLLPA